MGKMILNLSKPYWKETGLSTLLHIPHLGKIDGMVIEMLSQKLKRNLDGKYSIS